MRPAQSLERLATPRDPCRHPSCALFDDLPDASLQSSAEPSSAVPQVWTEGDELYDAMLTAIAAATCTIRLESFIFADDAVGQRFAAALETQARAGLRVQVHVDALRVWIDRSQRLLAALQRAGVQLAQYGALHVTQPRAFLRRNHRKLLIVDEQKAFLGGFNIHRQSSRAEAGARRWRDTHVEVCGAMASVAAQVFDTMWEGAPASSFPGCARAIAGEMIVADTSLPCRHRLRCLFNAVFAQATRRIYLTTPYFVPHATLENALRDAARRGVDVRLLVPRHSNHPVALAAGRARYRTLLASGVRIFEYLPRLLHAKTAVVDGRWVTIGTANLDYLSLFSNHELNLVSNRAALAAQLEEHFMADLSEAIALDRRTWAGRSIGARIAERAAWSVRRWL